MTDMMKPGTKSQIKSGLRRAGLVLFFLLIAGLFCGGVVYVFFPTGHSRILGGAFLAISAVVMIAEMNRWVRVLPGILGLAVLNGLISLFTGHALNNSSAPISRADMLLVTLFFAACFLVARTFAGHELTLIHRVALMLFAFTLPLWAGHDSTRVAVAGRSATEDRADLIIGAAALGCLLVPWAYDRIQRQRDRRHGGKPNPGHGQIMLDGGRSHDYS